MQPLMTSFFFPDDMVSNDPYYKEGTCRIYKRKKLANSKRFYLNKALVRKRLLLKDWETPVVEDPNYKLLFEEAKRLVLKSKKYDNFNKKKNLEWIAEQLNIESNEEAMRMWKELVPVIQRPKVLRDILDVENEQTEKVRVVKRKYVRRHPEQNPAPSGGDGLTWNTNYE